MQTNYQEILNHIYDIVKAGDNLGYVASYIPELATVDPEKFGVTLTTIDEQVYSVGDYQERFSIQSIAKVLSLSLAYKLLGVHLWDRLGVEPSGNPFNSLVQLEYDLGIPRNPFINAGAIVICDVLYTELEHPYEDLLAYIRHVSDCPNLTYNSIIANSEKSVGYRNIAVTNFLKSFGNIENEAEEVLEFYFHLCSIQMSCEELSRTFLFLANHGQKINGEEILNIGQAKRINAIMQTCGFYDEAGDFAYKVGLPGKSGVGGGIAAVLPGAYSIALWSPRLNEKGNSYRGVKFLEFFTTKTGHSIF
ncbi:glutaminase [Algivirga pacifica]|uniref:Glutaminase n=1 Tax=Algivirga pacifica TaxID=1162670 RepID=A0ABP9DHG0_9BACT